MGSCRVLVLSMVMHGVGSCPGGNSSRGLVKSVPPNNTYIKLFSFLFHFLIYVNACN